MKTESITVDGFTISVGVLQSDAQIPTIILEIRANPEQKQTDAILSPCYGCMSRTPLPPPTPEEAKKITKPDMGWVPSPNIISHNPPQTRNNESAFFVPVTSIAHFIK